MALSPAGDSPTPAEAPRPSLHDDEHGTAAVEFVILLPVYLLILFGLFSISFLVLARQSLPIVARHYAWSGPLEAEHTQGIVGNFADFSASAPVEDQVPESSRRFAFEGTEAAAAGGGSSSPDQQQMAADIFNNDLESSAAPYVRRTVEAKLDYTGLLVGTREVSIAIDACVLVALPHARPLHKEGEQNHPVAMNAGRMAPFDPSNNLYLDPIIRATGQNGFTTDRQGMDPGIWDVDARIGGGPLGVRTEHQFYRGQNVKR